MASPAEIAAQRRQQQLESERRMRSATQRPTASSRGGGFEGPALKPRKDPTYDATATPPAVPLPTNLPPRTKKTEYGPGDV